MFTHMDKIILSNPIDNTSGYIDFIESQILNYDKESRLEMLITCVGGDVFQGARLERAISMHPMPTKATVVGIAASMGAVLLSAFDEVEIDSKAEIMLHKAHLTDDKGNPLSRKKYTAEQWETCNRFNLRAYKSLLKKGVNQDFLEDVFVSEETKDFWLTAKEAESIGLGYVTEVVRENSSPQVMRLAAEYTDQKTAIEIYNNYNKSKMGLFSKKAEPLQKIVFANGVEGVFNSASKELKKGDAVSVIGSDKPLSGKVRINAKLVAEFDEEGKVEAIEEELMEVGAEVTPEQFAELSGKVSAIEETVKMLVEKMTPNEEAVEAIKNEVKEKVEDMEKDYEETKNTLNALVAKLGDIKGGIMPPRNNASTQEGLDESHLSGLTDSEKRAYRMKQTLNKLKA
jgi:ATP-dependent protease ClpP protease subunit